MATNPAAIVETVTAPSRASRINELHADIEGREEGTYVLALEAGRLLKAAKSSVGYGNWLPWLAINCPDVSRRTVSEWMGLVNKEALISSLAEANGKRASHLSIRAAKALITPEKDDDDDGYGKEPVPEQEPTVITELRKLKKPEELIDCLERAIQDTETLKAVAATLQQKISARRA